MEGIANLTLFAVLLQSTVHLQELSNNAVIFVLQQLCAEMKAMVAGQDATGEEKDGWTDLLPCGLGALLSPCLYHLSQNVGGPWHRYEQRD